MRAVEDTLSTYDGDLRPGTQIAEYVIDEVIGRGGMGIVYRAIHPEIHSRVAIKVLAMERLRDPLNVTRFIQEARTANEIRHENIVDVYTVGRLPNDQVYCVMEYLEGTSLMHHMRTCGKLSLAETIDLLAPVARALDAAHAKGVVHRDIKPANIFLVREPSGHLARVKLLDFGIAKLLATEDRICDYHTQTGTVIGTPAYMSPEQCRGKDVGPRADIYCLGVVAYEMLTGRLPYLTDSFGELLLYHQTQLPTPPSELDPGCPPSVDEPILRAMHKDARCRFATASELIVALASELSQEHPIAVAPPEPEPEPRRRWVWAPLAAAGLGLTLVAARSPSSEPPPLPTAALVAAPAVQPPPPPPPPPVIAPPPVAPVKRAAPARVARKPTPPPSPAPAVVEPPPVPAHREVVPDLPVKF